MIDEVAKALARLSTRDHFTGPDDLVFPGTTGDHLDGSAPRRCYGQAQAAAGLRTLCFHDLRHVFGSRVLVVQVQHWMEHADSDTTHRYLHYTPRRDEAKLIPDAFAVKPDTSKRKPPLDVDYKPSVADWIKRDSGEGQS